MLHLIAWLLVFGVFAIQFALENKIRQDPTVLKTTFYYPLQRTIWPLCLCWISYTCLSGYANWVNWFLSLPLFQVISKIIYSTYLVHLTIISVHVNNYRTLPYFTNYDLVSNETFLFLWNSEFKAVFLNRYEIQ